MLKFLLIICLLCSQSLFGLFDIKRPDSLFTSSDYENALNLYKESLLNPELSSVKRQYIQFKIAQTYYLLKEFNQTIQLLKQNHKTLQESYLLAFSYRKQGEHEKAIEVLEQFSENKPSNDFLQIELALNYYETNELKKAEELLTSLVSDDQRVLLYLTRIYLKQFRLNEAERILKSIKHNEAVQGETYLLQGEFYYLKNEFPKALEAFQNASKWFDDSNLRKEILFRIAQTHIKLGRFDEAEQILLKLPLNEERVAIALAESHLINSIAYKPTINTKKIKKFLKRPSMNSSSHSQLLHSFTENDYQKRNKLYRKLTREENKNQTSYALAWLYKGINDFEQGKKLLLNNQTYESSNLFNQSTSALNTAVETLDSDLKPAICLAKKTQAYAYYIQSSENSLQNCLTSLEYFLNETENLDHIDNPDEIYYLHGLTLAKMTNKKAMHSLKTGIGKYPQGAYAPNMLYLLGILSFQNKNLEEAELYLTRLAKEFSDSPLTPQSLFWAAKAEPSLNIRREYLHQIFTKYPDSPLADLAYFSYYPISEYLNGESNAISHLLEMPKKHPISPYNLYAYYLKGVNSKKEDKTDKPSLIESIESFQDTEDHFDHLYSLGLINENYIQFLANIRYRAIIERAKANLTLAENMTGAEKNVYLDYTEKVLQSLTSDFEDKNHPLTRHLIFGESFPYLLEEASFWLAQVLHKSKKHEQSKNVLTWMLEKYNSAKITRGYYLSKVWYSKALIEMDENKYKEALNCFSHAKDTAKGKILASDEILDLLIQESECHKQLGDLDQAMLILSRAINYDAVSELRVKAMYLRAEIYRQQERHDLAKKQLEATATKGGGWAVKAQEKLREQYVY